MTALHWAVYHDDVSTAEELIERGADIDSATRYGIRPLSIASQNGSAELVRRLLEEGAEPDAARAGRETPLMLASRTGRIECVEALLASGARVDATERRGQTALMWAAAAGHADVVGRLLEAGAARDRRLRSGFSAFLFAVREGRLDVVRSLLEAGVDPQSALQPGRARGEGAWKKAGAKETGALVLAIENGHFELALALVDAGADPNDERSGRAPLHALVGVRKTPRGDGEDGNPPPRGSGQLTSLQLVRALVDRGADINRPLASGRRGKVILSGKGATPFLLASASADLPLMRLLLELGADSRIANADGCTPFLAAAGMGVRAPGEEPGTEAEALEALKLLLELGADINAIDRQGETAMHCAAYKSAPKIIEFLAERGADLEVWNQRNQHGWTPLVIAQGFRPGNYKPSPPTIAALERVLRAAGVTPPPPPKRR